MGLLYGCPVCGGVLISQSLWFNCMHVKEISMGWSNHGVLLKEVARISEVSFIRGSLYTELDGKCL